MVRRDLLEQWGYAEFIRGIQLEAVLPDYEEAISEYEAGNYPVALTLLESVVGAFEPSDPEWQTAQQNLGMCQARVGRMDEARVTLRRVGWSEAEIDERFREDHLLPAA